MNCKGCSKHVSEHSDHLVPRPHEFWHPNCWVNIFWHVGDNGRMRPMTTAEKVAYVEKNSVSGSQ